MASSSKQPGPSKLIVWLGPVALVLIGYSYVLNFGSEQRSLSDAYQSLENAKEADVSDGQVLALRRQMSEISSKTNELDEQLRSLVSRRLALAGQVALTPPPSTEIVAKLSQWCEKHHLAVHHHTPDSNVGSSMALARLNRLAHLPTNHDFSPWVGAGEPDGMTIVSTGRSANANNEGRLVQLFLQATYADMQHALADLETSGLPVWPISIEMTGKDLQQPVKDWVITVWF